MAEKSQIYESGDTAAQIKFQHHELHDQIDSINKAIHHHVPHEQLVSLALETRQSLEAHFTAEETLMDKIKYPKSRLLQHKTSHMDALAQLNKLVSHLSLDNITSRNFFEFLFDWTYMHELNEDKELSMFLSKLRSNF